MDNAQEFLAHHGIKGQKWGVRRFQEEDGELTAAGRARYNVGLERSKRILQEAKDELKKLRASPDRYDSSKVNKAQAKKIFAQDQYRNEKALQEMSERKNSPGKREISLIEKYKSEGMTQNEAEVAAYRRAKAERIAAIAGTVTIAAAASYVAYKHWDAVGDRFIKEGRTVQNLSTDSTKDVQNAFYGTFNKQDQSKYVGLFGGRHLAGKDVYAMNATVKEGGMKVAGDKNAQKVLREMLKNDTSFKSDVAKRMDNLVYGTERFGWESGRKKARIFSEHLAEGKLTKGDYRFFNTMLVDHTPSQQVITDKFYDTLKKRGYDAVMDVNDKWQSGYRAKSPIIVFNGNEKLANKVNFQMNPEVMAKGRQFWERKLKAQEMRKAFVKSIPKQNPLFPINVLMIPISIVSGNKAKKKTANEVHNRLIRQYKKEHPNTALSNTEILRNIYGYA